MGKKSKTSKKAKQSCSVLLWHKTFIKRIRQRFGMSKYQMLWITFGKGLLRLRPGIPGSSLNGLQLEARGETG